MDTQQEAAGARGTQDVPAATGITVRYWAGARAAAGVDTEPHTGPVTVDALRAAMTSAHPELATVLPVCSVLVDGLAADGADPVPDGAVVEVLPPFAGG
ncbi:MoaD/ThiS family protein [Phycicoccus flavus]|uniref:MoaD/ThiS family protein n=1 Tax=Phycicoccus flavus TaxID=2502783 RepID=UPI000FEC0039|nr:MoaD/ThiS family protein [Phycicoccus flavus]NHA66631.1 MoaD/ThiS family protein [Phycicoccus flavus]